MLVEGTAIERGVIDVSSFTIGSTSGRRAVEHEVGAEREPEIVMPGRKHCFLGYHETPDAEGGQQERKNYPQINADRLPDRGIHVPHSRLEFPGKRFLRLLHAVTVMGHEAA